MQLRRLPFRPGHSRGTTRHESIPAVPLPSARLFHLPAPGTLGTSRNQDMRDGRAGREVRRPRRTRSTPELCQSRGRAIGPFLLREIQAMPTLPQSIRVRSGGARAWALFVVTALTCLALAPMPRLRAQDAKEEAPAEAPAASATPAPAPAEGTAPPKQKSMLRWAIEASGPIGVFLLCLSVYFTA